MVETNIMKTSLISFYHCYYCIFLLCFSNNTTGCSKKKRNINPNNFVSWMIKRITHYITNFFFFKYIRWFKIKYQSSSSTILFFISQNQVFTFTNLLSKRIYPKIYKKIMRKNTSFNFRFHYIWIKFISRVV